MVLLSKDRLILHTTYRSQYRLLGLIGQGQFGRVYCAVHRRSGRLYALKDLEHRVFPTNKFLRELTYLVTLRHPHIVVCHALEYHATGRYLVMDYCEGGTLRDLMDGEGELVLFRKLQLVQEILAALAHAHQANIIHCDIKPENILLVSAAQGWHAKISDFGIARLTEITGNPNYGKGYTGSPAYMAPERFYGKFSPASDLYAVGVMLYELICGDRPFSGLPGELQKAHFNRRLNFPPDFPPSLIPVVSQALEKLPQRRFQSATEMGKALQAATLASLGLNLNDKKELAIIQNRRPFFSLPSDRLSEHKIQVLQNDGLAFQVNHLEVSGQQVYLSMGNQLVCRHYEKTDFVGRYNTLWDSYFNVPILSLHPHPQGIAIFTRETSRQKGSALFRYQLYLLAEKQPTRTIVPVPVSHWIGTKFVYRFDPLGQWLAIATQQDNSTDRGEFQIIKTANWQPLAPAQSTLFPSQLIALDHRHGLTIFLAKTANRQATVFRLFNRRSQLIRAFALPILLTNLHLNLYSRNHLLGLDLTDRTQAFLIRLQPLKVNRIALEREADFIVTYPWGYLLAHREGRIMLLDDDGFHIGQFDLKEPITAIASLNRYQFLVALWKGDRGSLQVINLGENLDEIIEQKRNQD